MANIKINLLPWREELREEKKNEFLKVWGAVVVVALVLIGGTDRYYTAAIDNQNSRNNFLKQEIKVLEERIDEIRLLQQNRNELLARMTVIQNLQGNRPIIVRLFDELARRLAPRVFYNSLELKGEAISIEGIAESYPRISAQLRNFAESDWFDKPNVTEISADPAFGPQASRFSLSIVQSAPKKEEDDED